MDTGSEGQQLGTALPGGRLRRVDGGRQRVVKVRLSVEEEAWLVPRAAAMGVSVQRLLVESAMPGGPVPPAERRAVYRLLETGFRDLREAAVNLNQLARWGNEERQLPPGIAEAVQRLEVGKAAMLEAAERLAEVFGRSRKGR